MIKLEEKDFITGNNDDRRGALLIREDCNGYIDTVLNQIYELNLTKEEEKELGIDVHREKYDNSWKMVKFYFGLGNEIIFSKNDSIYRGKLYKTTHELTCNGQLDSDKAISALSGFGIIGSHRLFSYQEKSEILNFNEGNEIFIKIDDENNLTQYLKLDKHKSPRFEPKYGEYTCNYLSLNDYKKEYRYVDGKNQYVEVDLEGNPLTQSELIATTFDSFENSYVSYNEKFNKCRELIDARMKEITDRKTK